MTILAAVVVAFLLVFVVIPILIGKAIKRGGRP